MTQTTAYLLFDGLTAWRCRAFAIAYARAAKRHTSSPSLRSNPVPPSHAALTDWLASIGLERYAERFEQDRIDLDVLPT